MASTIAQERGDTAARNRAYLERKGLPRLMKDFFEDLFQREELPANPYPDLVRRFRIEEHAMGLFRSLDLDAKASAGMVNNVARSPELSGVTYVQGSRCVWGMPHMLRIVDVAHVDAMGAVLNANESCLRADAHEIDTPGEDCHVNVWVALTGPAALVGRLFREFWADVQLAVGVEIITQNFQLAIDLFAETILVEAKGCQGSNQLLLRRVVIDYPLRQKGVSGRERTAWTPQQLHDTPDAFISEIKSSLPFRPSVKMTYLFLPPKGSHRTVGGPIVSIQRSYTMHYRNSTKANMSLSSQPFQSLYNGVFLSGVEAKHYGELFRAQGLSFPVEGVAGAKGYLAENVERAREVGDTLGMHAALLPLSALSGVVEDQASVPQATVDVSRVTKSAAARHRSLRNWCDSILFIMGLVAEWAQASQPILKWDEASPVDDDSEEGENGGRWNRKTRCRSSKDLFQTWLRTAHLLFWGWRCEVLRYLDEDRHSDVVVVKNNVRGWIEEISSAARMGLRLPMLRWHDHGRTIADGKAAFLGATDLARQRLGSLSAWLHCLDLSLAWDAARVCDRVHVQHLQMQSKIDVAPQGGWPSLLGFQLPGSGGHAQGHASSLPTTASLLQLQRCWLDDVAVATHIRDIGAGDKTNKRKSRRQDKSSAASTAAAVEAAVANGIRYVSAPAAPNSTKAPAGLDVRLAVVETLREDIVPEAFAHEITLMKYAADNGIDKSLHSSIDELLTSVLTPNPFPALTDALAISSLSLVLRRTVDPQDSIITPAVLKRVGGAGENSGVFEARGTRKGANVYGSKPALTEVDVEAALSLFEVLPPVAGWVLDELGGNCTDVDVGIFGCPQQHGSHVHHDVVPSDITVLLACACDFDLNSGKTPMEHFTCCAVRCATAAHKKSALLVVGLTARTSFEDKSSTPPAEGPSGGERFLLQQVLDEPEEVEDGLTHLDPEEIVLEALVPYPIPTGGEALVPVSIRFLIVSEARDDDVGCREASAAAMFYNCVFTTAHAAGNVAARHAVLTADLGLPETHYLERTRRRVLESLDSRNYLEAYRLVHCLRCLRLIVPDDEESVPTTPGSEEADSCDEKHLATSRRRAWEVPLSSGAAGSESIMGMTTALEHMLKGPAGRLDHARRLLNVLRKVVLRENLAPEALALLDGELIREHARYCISYLLDAFAEQPQVRFEGAIQSIKLRARLLLDRVTDMTAAEGLGEAAARAVGSDAAQEAAGDLVVAVASMLEIVQLAVESDTHRCCPEIDPMLERFRRIESRTGNKPTSVVGRGGRRAAPAKKSPGVQKSSKTGGVRFG